jgi:hypothetical protein
MSKNRFASLYLDDDDESPSCGPLISLPPPLPLPPIPIPITEEKPAFVPTQPRTWSKDEATPDTTRDWNMEPKRKFRQPFSRGYAFQEDGVSKFIPLKSYAFEDESAAGGDSVRPNTPIDEKIRHSHTSRYPRGDDLKFAVRKSSPLNPSPKVDVQSQDEFPKLSDYNRPTTPPYPPDDGDYPTLAERMKRLIKKEEEAKFNSIEPMETFEMISVIPMRTNLSGNFLFHSFATI